MTTYDGSIDQTEDSANGTKFSAIAGAAITKGMALKFDGSTAKTVVVTTATSSLCIGIARNSATTGESVCVLSNGCKVVVPYTLTLGASAGCGAAGAVADWSVSGTRVGVCETSAASASVLRIKIQY